MEMKNLLNETEEELATYGLTWDDVKFVRAHGCCFTDIDQIRSMMDFNYNADYGMREVDLSLVVVGDNWWLERETFDGAEWWELGTMPTRPEQQASSYPNDTFRSMFRQ